LSITTPSAPAAWNRPLPSGRDYISFSAVSTLQSCSLRYFFKYVRGLPEETISASLVLGSAIHGCLQFHFEQLLAGADPPDLDTLLDVFNDSWRARDGQKIVFAKGEDINSIDRPVGTLSRRSKRRAEGRAGH
jgi:putative RecB family exonuclease